MLELASGGLMPKATDFLPPGYHTATHALVVDDAAKALDFYSKALGAKERNRMPGPGGKVWHAEIEIGDSVIMISDEFPDSQMRSPKSLKGTSAAVWLYVPDVDVAFKQAVAAGAKSIREPTTMFWGDRFGSIVDPFGHSWSIATHVEDVPLAEMQKRREEAMKAMGGDGR
jgi:PhnB protein